MTSNFKYVFIKLQLYTSKNRKLIFIFFLNTFCGNPLDEKIVLKYLYSIKIMF